MKIFLIVILSILLLIALILVVRIKVELVVSEEFKRASLKICFVKISLFPRKNSKTYKKEARKDEKSQNFEKNIEQGIGKTKNLWYNNLGDIKEALLRLKKRLLIENFHFEYKCGFEDASKTAILYGTVSGLYYNIFAFLDRHFRVKNMNAEISPDFNSTKKHLALNLVLRLTVADILYILFAVLPIIKKLF